MEDLSRREICSLLGGTLFASPLPAFTGRYDARVAKSGGSHLSLADALNDAPDG